MALVESSPVQTGSQYIQMRVVSEYNASTAYFHLEGRRTNAYSGNTYSNNATFTVSGVGTTSATAFTIVGGRQNQWQRLATLSASGNRSGQTFNWSTSWPQYSSISCSGTITLSQSITGQAFVPNSATLVSRTYNSITASIGVASTGSTGCYYQPGYAALCDQGNTTGSNQYGRLAFSAFTNNTAESWSDVGNRVEKIQYITVSSPTTYRMTVTNSDYGIVDNVCAGAGGYPFLKGCGMYGWGFWLEHPCDGGIYSTLSTVYLPPAPLTSCSVSGIKDRGKKLGVQATFTATGAQSGNLNIAGARVTTQYRCSINYGSSWGSWETIATDHDPGTTKSVTVTELQYDKNYLVQFRQYNQSDSTAVSDVYEVSFRTPKANILYASSSSKTKLVSKIYGSSTNAKPIKKVYVGGADGKAHTVWGFQNDLILPLPNKESGWQSLSTGCTVLEDNWIHLEKDNSNGTSSVSMNFWPKLASMPSLKNNTAYSLVFEVRNVTSGSDLSVNISQDSGSPAILFGNESIANAIDNRGLVFKATSKSTATSASMLIRPCITVQAGKKINMDIRFHIYEVGGGL